MKLLLRQRLEEFANKLKKPGARCFYVGDRALFLNREEALALANEIKSFYLPRPRNTCGEVPNKRYSVDDNGDWHLYNDDYDEIGFGLVNELID